MRTCHCQDIRKGQEIQTRLSKSYSEELKGQVVKECIETNKYGAVSSGRLEQLAGGTYVEQDRECVFGELYCYSASLKRKLC